MEELVTFLALAANAEPHGYPALAKLYHQRLGTISCAHTRAIEYDIRERHWALDSIIDHLIVGSEHFRRRLSLSDLQIGVA